MQGRGLNAIQDRQKRVQMVLNSINDSERSEHFVREIVGGCSELGVSDTKVVEYLKSLQRSGKIEIIAPQGVKRFMGFVVRRV